MKNRTEIIAPAHGRQEGSFCGKRSANEKSWNGGPVTCELKLTFVFSLK
jgi:hypothetical protein